MPANFNKHRASIFLGGLVAVLVFVVDLLPTRLGSPVEAQQSTQIIPNIP